MLSKFSTAALAATISFAASAAMAGAGDYAFEPVNPEMKKGDDVTLAVRLTNKQTGKPVSDAVIFRTRVDMAPDGLAEMESPVEPLPPKEPGVYAFKTDLPMAGRYQVTLSAKVQG
ncbi:FixH family protein, partial [Xanthomonas citri pv. citri]